MDRSTKAKTRGGGEAAVQAGGELLVFDRRTVADRGWWLECLSRPWVAAAPPQRDGVEGAEGGAEGVLAEVPLRVDDGLEAALHKLTGGRPFLLYTTVMAAVKACLHRYSGARRIAVGSPTRRHEDFAGVEPGAVVVVDEIDPTASFKQLLVSQRQSLLDAYAHQSYPFARLLRDLAASRDGEVPFCTAVELADLHDPWCVDGCPLVLRLRQGAGGLEGSAVYATATFRRATVERFLVHVTHLLRGALEDLERPLAHLPLVAGEERRSLLERAGRRTDYPRHATLAELFSETVKRHPDATALQAGGLELSYGELWRRAGGLARELRRAGVGPGERVALCGDRSPEMLVGILGTVLAAGAYVPLDPSYPLPRLQRMLADTAAKVLLRPASRAGGLDAGDALEMDLEGEWEAAEPPSLQGSSADLAYVLYTSGSTGRPKGVAVPQRAVTRLVREADFADFGPHHTFLQLAPLSFDASTLEIWAPWLHGGRLVLAPPGTPSLSELRTVLRDSGVTSLWLTAGLFHQVVADAPEALEGVQQLLAGGDVLAPAAVRRLLARLPGLRLINGYGPTENTTFTCCHRVDSMAEGEAVPIGRPVADSRVYVTDRGLELLPAGVAGELVTGGDGLARGYWRQPARTAERFVPDPFAGEPGARLYRTGDRVRWHHGGAVEFLGRLDAQVKVRGFRVEPGEVEAALTAHPAVSQAVVVARGEGADGKRLVAYVVAADRAAPPSAEELRRFLRDGLPEHLVPSLVVAVDELPLNANGKVDRAALPEPEHASERPWAPPRTPVEAMLARLWEEVLAVERVGVDDDFFALGGHSLLATRLISRLREAFQVELPVRTLFESSTVGELARQVELSLGAAPLAEGPIEVAPRDRALPLSFPQQRLWFIDRLEPGSSAYNMFMGLRMRGDLRVLALAAALSEIVRRHESLRTVFALAADGEPVQRVVPPEIRSLPMVDLSRLAAADREAELRRLGREEASRPFDLAVGPLLRLRLLRLDGAEHAMLLTLHHVVGDGWSLGVLTRELSTLHAAFAAGRPSPLPELPIQYADYAAWQRRWLEGDAMAAETAYWRRQLDALPPLLQLPTDRSREAVRSSAGAVCDLTVDAALTADLYALARARGATLFMVLLATFQVLLHRLSGQDDLAVGTPMAARNRLEIENLIGFFVNTLVLRADLAGNPSFGDLLDAAREVSLEAHRHQNLPFERLVEELQPERDLSRTPLFQSMFSLQNTPRSAVRLGRLELRPLGGLAPVHALFDLDLSVTEGGTLGLSLTYSTALFDAVTVERWTRGLHNLLRGVAARPRQRILELPMLDDGERRQLTVEWSRGGAAAPFLPVHLAVDRWAGEAPQRTAVEGEDGSLTFGELRTESDRLAAALRRAGVAADEPVALCARRGARTIAAVLGILKAGGAYLPLDPDHGSQRLAAILRDAGVRVLVVAPDLARELALGAETVVPLGAGEPSAPLSASPAPPAQQAAYVIYTSGSSGAPKGVVVPHGALSSYVAAAAKAFGIGPRDRCLQFSSLSFDASLEEVFCPLWCGATLVLRAPGPVQTGEHFLRRCGELGVTVLPLATAFWHLLVEAVEGGAASWPASLRLVVVGGEEVQAERLAQWSRQTAGGMGFVNAYGPTEAVISATHWAARGAAEVEKGRVPIGRPLAGYRSYVLNTALAPVPVGVTGELHLGGEAMPGGGSGLARGYLGSPALTAAAFVPDPWGDGGRLYRSGDLARWGGGGQLTFLGRRDDQVKLRGFRVEPAEVEAALLRLPGVRDAAVVLRHDLPGGDALVAYAVPSDLPVQRLRDALRRELPDYMVPAYLVPVIELPTTAAGKVDRGALPAPRVGPTAEGGHAAPRDPVELQVAQIWEQVLELPRVGIHDVFFDLGGHSLLAVHLVTRIEAVFGVSVPLQALFQRPTVAGLADLLRSGVESSPHSLVSIQPWGPRPPLYCVHPSGGSLLCYVDLARRMEKRPLFGFQAPGIGDRRPPVASLEELATLYVHELRRHQPAGPYRLCGWSMGGLVVFEMARRLVALGETVDPLVVLDAAVFSEAATEGASGDDPLALLAGFALDLGLPLDELPSRGEVEEEDPEALLRALLAEAESRGLVPAAYLGSHLFQVFRANVTAMATYRPRPLEVPLVLVRATGSVAPQAEADYGWRRLTSRVTVLDLPGDHYNLLREPHVGELARALDALLEAAP